VAATAQEMARPERAIRPGSTKASVKAKPNAHEYKCMTDVSQSWMVHNRIIHGDSFGLIAGKQDGESGFYAFSESDIHFFVIPNALKVLHKNSFVVMNSPSASTLGDFEAVYEYKGEGKSSGQTLSPILKQGNDNLKVTDSQVYQFSKNKVNLANALSSYRKEVGAEMLTIPDHIAAVKAGKESHGVFRSKDGKKILPYEEGWKDKLEDILCDCRFVDGMDEYTQRLGSDKAVKPYIKKPLRCDLIAKY
jgi:hypothetical protein